ncbi:MAG TPA: hypothetical protein DDW94_00015 [Deltaproteobacteria bacterium]|nr:MAG: hypothetical protein A2Z79_05380 [Deltaproteobacteria bacterium GWA2_55_82]OGQ63777.1 MAG: hypothetical protein A3I81_09600 [Deltaproteobacteria bacterium RIFCSPLOWO2_02_FULL_55_12]OIJ73369.1 MAG: hypothetical protein A2V21_303280 [Deltaproteobacteria bacterium GWC2_55_46]HBG45355.1 hypothetical protein [Deltaproteobacteria bacterium]HCY10186.1 hypothetical protein [Deltaproteobacteria bacterium]
MDRLKALWAEEKRLDRASVQAHLRDDKAAMARLRAAYFRTVNKLIQLVILPERRNTPGMKGRKR